MEQLSILQAVILGIVQGLTEFLPVSSSGHLIITRDLLHFPDPGKTFDIMMHMGTLIALIIYFRRDLLEVLRGFFAGVRRKKFYGEAESNLFWFLIISTIPGAVFGAIFNDSLENIKNIYLISGLLIFFGIILFLSDRIGKKLRSLENLSLRDSILIGLSQAAALFPGVSRSGITMTTALFLGFNRETAARYSFLMSVPLIGGISLYGLYKLLKAGPDFTQMAILAAGFIAAIVSGFLCIKFLLDYLKKGTFNGFVIYRVALGIFLIVMGLRGFLG